MPLSRLDIQRCGLQARDGQAKVNAGDAALRRRTLAKRTYEGEPP
jgi:hypothetical protein